MEDQSTIALLDWFDWLMDWMDWLIFILLDWFWDVFAYAHSLAVAYAERGLQLALLFAFLSILKAQLPHVLHIYLTFPNDLNLLICVCLLIYSFVGLVYLFVSCRHAFLCLSPLQDLTMKLSLIQSVGLIGKAISQCVKKQGYVFARKQEFINVMLVSSQSFIVC